MGHVERILVRARAGDRALAVETARVVAGRGIVGDRYHEGTGTYSGWPGDGRDLTLIAAEALAALAEETGIALRADDTGRNVLTRGVDLDALVGRRFRIGEVLCRGVRPCEPCRLLERRTAPGVLRGLAGRGGLRADVLRGGVIVVGAIVEACPSRLGHPSNAR
jgi:MOSC domain-containing protein YiiM